MSKGFTGLALKVWRADDYELTVTGHETVGENYLRLSLAAGGLLDHHPLHPTQWIRLWIPTGDNKAHQRGYTIVNPEPDADSFDIEFALHDGPAMRWATNATIGDTIEATVHGSKFTLPESAPSEYLIFGDTASLPAINTLLESIGDVPARVWLEWQRESDRKLPVHATPATSVQWLQRIDKGQMLREAASELTCDPDAFCWIACDNWTTRAIRKTIHTNHGLPKDAVKAMAYWM